MFRAAGNTTDSADMRDVMDQMIDTIAPKIQATADELAEMDQPTQLWWLAPVILPLSDAQIADARAKGIGDATLAKDWAVRIAVYVTDAIVNHEGAEPFLEWFRSEHPMEFAEADGTDKGKAVAADVNAILHDRIYQRIAHLEQIVDWHADRFVEDTTRSVVDYGADLADTQVTALGLLALEALVTLNEWSHQDDRFNLRDNSSEPPLLRDVAASLYWVCWRYEQLSGRPT